MRVHFKLALSSLQFCIARVECKYSKKTVSAVFRNMKTHRSNYKSILSLLRYIPVDNISMASLSNSLSLTKSILKQKKPQNSNLSTNFTSDIIR